MPSSRNSVRPVEQANSVLLLTPSSQQLAKSCELRKFPPLSTILALSVAVVLIDFPISVFELSITVQHHEKHVGDILSLLQFILKLIAAVSLSIHCIERVIRKWVQPSPLNSCRHYLLLLVFCGAFTGGSLIRLFNEHPVSFAEERGSVFIRWYNGNNDEEAVERKSVNFSILSVMFLPLLLGVIFQDILREYTWVSWVVCLVSLIAVSIKEESSPRAFATVYYFLLSGLIFYSMRQHQRIVVYRETRKEQAKEAEIQEFDLNMKHLVGNVAHDLKTPLASFMSGLEIIEEVAKEAMELTTADRAIDRTILGDLLTALLQSTRNIRNTNNFMMMTIHRCIDYTKASKGLRLQPKLETIDLEETLALPLECMKDIQHRVEVRMAPLPPRICSHILTDKQWLQENLLCLLSNAVKYSSGGIVEVRVCLADEPADNAPDSVCGGGDDDQSVCSSVATRVRDYRTAKLASSLESARTFSTAPRPPTHKQISSLKSQQAQSAPPQTSRLPAQLLVVEVEDSGIGMTSEAMSALFSPFQQAQRLAGGTGLGLFSLAKRVEALHGCCGVSKREDGQQGSLFWFAFPYRPDIQFATSTTVRHHKRSLRSLVEPLSSPHGVARWIGSESSYDKLQSPEHSSLPSLAVHPTSLSMETVPFSRDVAEQTTQPHGLRILLVEDSPFVTKLMTTMLRRHGYEVTDVGNGAEMLAAITTPSDADPILSSEYPRFDVILSDVQLPVMDGLEAVRRLREWEASQPAALHHVVMGLSAITEPECVEECLQCGFDTFLSKPFSISIFWEECRRLRVRSAVQPCASPLPLPSILSIPSH